MSAIYDEYIKSKQPLTSLNVAGVNIPIPQTQRSVADVPAQISAVKPSALEQVYQKYFPQPVKTALSTIKEGLFGRGQEVDIAGNLKERGGLLRRGATESALSEFIPGFSLRPKTDMAKYEDRLKALVEKGTEPTKASQIAYLDITHPQMNNYLGRKKVLAEAGATEKDIKVLNQSAAEDVTRAVGGLIDATTFGGGSLAKGAAAKIAASADELAIKSILKGEFKDLSDEAAGVMSKVFKHIDDPIEVEGAFNRIKMQLQAQKAAEEIPATTRALKMAEELPAGMKERRYITSAKRVVPEASKIAGQYVPRSTDVLATKAKDLIASDIVTAERRALTETSDDAVAIASELIKKYGDDAAKADPSSAMAMYDKAAEIANTLAPKLTELGRSIQAASILGRLTPEGQLRFAAREIARYNEANPTKKIAELSGEEAQKILTSAKEINDMEDGVEKARAFKELQDSILERIPTPIMKKITAVWKAGLLTGIKTTGLNLFANLSHTVSEVAKDIPATVVDKVASLFTGKRTKTFSLNGLPKGMRDGFKKGLEYFKTGFDERNASKIDYRKVNFGTGPVAKAFQAYTDTVFRAMGAGDQPFYYGAVARSLGDQALAEGMNQGLKGKALKEFAENLIENPTEEMIRFATADAATAVFNNETYLGNAAKALQSIPVAGEILIPFGRTPSAVATQIVNYTPAGTAIEIVKQINNKKFDQRKFSEAVGRGLTGTAAMAIGALLAKEGLMSLDYPTTEREQKLWELEGRKPNTIKVGDEWRSVASLGPAGYLLLVGGQFNQAFQQSGSPTEALVSAIGNSEKSFIEQTFLSNLKQAVDSVSDPDRYAFNYLKNMVSSLVPTIVSDVARASDRTERRAETIPEAIKGRIPGVRGSLEPKVNVLGEEVKISGNPLEILIDPTRPSKDISTPTVKELRRLTDAGQAVSPTLVSDKTGSEALTPKQNTELWKRTGEIVDSKLTSLFNLPAYRELSDEKKGKKVEQFVDKAKVIARAEMAIKLTEGLTGAALRDKLSELKKGKLLNEEVFNKYKELR